MSNRRLGKFWIRGDVIAESPSDVMKIMGQCVIIRAEHLYASDAIEYIAYSPQFATVKEGEIAPTYEWVCRDGNWTAKQSDVA